MNDLQIDQLIERVYVKLGPINKYCCICNKELTYKQIYKKQYKSSYIGPNLVCSKECGYTKAKKTCLDKYGVDNPAKNPDIAKKTLETTIKRYGKNTGYCMNNNRHKFSEKVKQRKIQEEFLRKQNRINLSKIIIKDYDTNSQLYKSLLKKGLNSDIIFSIKSYIGKDEINQDEFYELMKDIGYKRDATLINLLKRHNIVYKNDLQMQKFEYEIFKILKELNISFSYKNRSTISKELDFLYARIKFSNRM